MLPERRHLAACDIWIGGWLRVEELKETAHWMKWVGKLWHHSSSITDSQEPTNQQSSDNHQQQNLIAANELFVDCHFVVQCQNAPHMERHIHDDINAACGRQIRNQEHFACSHTDLTTTSLSFEKVSGGIHKFTVQRRPLPSWEWRKKKKTTLYSIKRTLVISLPGDITFAKVCGKSSCISSHLYLGTAKTSKSSFWGRRKKRIQPEFFTRISKNTAKHFPKLSKTPWVPLIITGAYCRKLCKSTQSHTKSILWESFLTASVADTATWHQMSLACLFYAPNTNLLAGLSHMCESESQAGFYPDLWAAGHFCLHAQPKFSSASTHLNVAVFVCFFYMHISKWDNAWFKKHMSFIVS